MKIYNPTGFSSNLTGSFSGSVKGIFDGSFTSAATTEISGAFDSVSSSLSSRVASQENFSSSLDNTFATDADLNLVSSSVDSLNAASSSYALETLISGSFTSISSSIASELLKNTTDTLTGDLTVTGTLTAQDLHVQEVTSSIVYSSGSNIFGSQSSDIQQITGSLYLAEGEVGINATANYFSEKLFVGGLTRTLGLHVAQGIGNSNYGIITHNDDLLEISTDSSRVSGTGHIILSPYGNVGIGTTSPSHKLDVTGDQIRLLRDANDAVIRVANTSGNAGAYFTANSGYPGFSGIELQTTGTTDWYIGSYSYADFSITDGTKDGGTRAFTVQNTTGNVGIGTTSPEFKLDVTGSMRTTAFLVVSGSDTQPADIIPFNKPSGSSVNIGTYISSYGFIDISSTHNDGGWIDFSDGSGIDYRGRIRYYNSVDTFKIFTGQSGASTMEISSANKVSIGGASTDGYLEIKQSNNTPSIRLNNGANPSGAYYDLISYTNGYLYLYRNGSTVSVLSDTNGNMGIGTSAPTQPLTVDGGATAVNQGIPATSGTSQNGILRLTSGDATYGETLDFGMNVATTYGWIQATNRDSLAVNYNLALNPNGGNVGIGTTSPNLSNSGTALTVNSAASANAAVEISDGGTLAGLLWGRSGTGVNVWSIPSIPLTFGTANTERMRITSSGNVELKPTDPVSMAGADTNYLGFRVTQTNAQSALLGTIYGQGVSGWGGKLIFRTKPDNGTPNDSTNIAMVIDENQDIGIGTTDPFNTYSGVSILGSDASIAQKTTSASGWTWSQYVNSSGTNNFSAGVNHSVPYWGVKAGAGMDNPHLSVNSDGNVGVGTNNAGNKFLVSGESTLQGTNIFGFTGNNYGGNNHSHTFAGYGVPAAGSDRYSSYGFLVLNANTNYTGAARKFGITNAFQANKFAILIGSSSLAAPGLTNYGNLETGTILALTITNSGEVGIGTDSPSVGFHVEQRTLIDSGGSSDIITLQNDNGGFVLGNTTNQASMDLSTGQALRIRQGSNSKIFVNTNGEVILGSDSVTTISTDFIHSIGNVNRGSLASGAYARLVMQERTGDWISFVNGTPVHYGTISVNGSGVSYGSNSDYRLKENILDLSSSIDKVKLLKPKTFNFLDRPDNNVTGFLAHEVQEVIPEAVTGQKNGTIITGDVTEDSTGKVLESNIQEPVTLEEGTTFTATKTEPKYQQLDPAKLVPVLTGALKELIAKVETLEAEIEALKNA